MTVSVLFGVVRRDSGGCIALRTPNPHEVPLESLHNFRSTVFLSGVRFTSAVLNILFAVFVF
jgi:hypothetical protein